MANATLTLTASVPNPKNVNADYGTRAIMAGLLNQAAQTFGSGLATSGNLTWPPGADAPIVGTWVYVPPS